MAKQLTSKEKATGCGCVIIIALIIGILAIFGSCVNTTPEMVDLHADKKIQFDQAEKLKPSAFIIAQKFVKDTLKAPDTAKFGSFTENSVMWWENNTFLVTVVVDAQNSFGAMLRKTIMCEVEYTGNDRWNLIQMGSPEQIMRKKAPELVAAAEAERKSAEEKLNAQADKEIARLKELERKQEQKRQEERFQEWKKTYLLNIPDNKKLRQFRFYILPNAIKLYSDNECKTVKQEIAKGELFEVMPTRQRKLDNSYSIHVYQGWKGDSRPDTSSYISGWIKTDEFK